MKQITQMIIALAVAVAIGGAYTWMAERLDTLTAENSRYRGDMETLLSDVKRYRVNDSLNAARVQALELTMKEYERFRAEDAELIRTLKARNRDLSAVNKTQEATIIELRAVPHDTVIVVHDSIMVPAVSVHCGDSWYDFEGLLSEGQFTGKLTNRDSLILVESVRYKRFLFWKTRRVKDRRLDAMNKNPHTTITGIEYVTIENK